MSAEFKTGRIGHFFVGVGAVALFATTLYLSFGSSSERLQNTHMRRGGVFKVIEQVIGWELFVLLMLLFGLWCLNYGIVSMWKVFDRKPDVIANEGQLKFHPAVKRDAVPYSEVDCWTLEFVSGHPVLTIYLKTPYWSLQGLFRRKSIKLEGGRSDMEPLVEYFYAHPKMANRLVRR